jgi:pyrimidine-specific ribonucleoside hydrolase
MPIPLIVDTDPGVDDAVALILALHSPEVQVRAVTATYGNVGLADTHANARRVVALAGRAADVPVAAGAARPLVHPQAERAPHVHGADGLGGHSTEFPEPDAPGPGPTSALGLAAAVLRAAEQPVTITSIGPLTNTALLLAAHPELASKIGRIVVMGGALSGGNVSAVSEFNVHADPEAAHRVLTQDEVPVTLVPLDLTLRCLADSAWLATLDASGPRCALLGRVIAPYRTSFRRRYGIDAFALHDAVAMLEAVSPGALQTTPMPVSVACDFGPARGMLVPDRRPGALGPPVDVAVDADLGRVLAEILARVRRLN